jgi:tRNA (guanine37-N1)-methyltransferase
MLAACTELKDAQKIKEYLLKHNLLNTNFSLVKELGLIYFPLKKKVNIPFAKTVNTKFSFPERQNNLSVEVLLRNNLTPSELELLPKSQEIVGTILILEIPKELQKKEKAIAEAYLQFNHHLTTVVKKDESHSGTYRTRTVKILAGKRTKETLHSENGIRLKLNLEKTYFSARTANERLRISHQIKKPETVLVMFSGAAPLPLVIARNSPAKKIYGIEINPFAHQYALENIKLNNCEDKVIIYNGDVRVIIPKLKMMKMKFDRIAMPLPKTGEQFLDDAFKVSKRGTIIHLYAFLAEEEFSSYRKKIIKICSGLKHKVKVLRTVRCGQFSPRIFRVCFDIKVVG